MKREKGKRKNKYQIPLKLDKINWEKTGKIFTVDRQILLKKIENEKNAGPRIKDILILLAGGLVISLSLMIPTAPLALAPFILDKKKHNIGIFQQTIRRLKGQKLVEVVDDGKGNPIVKITDQGRVRALRYKLSEIRVKKPKVWDKKWRVVIFDIPEKYKRSREIFRKHLQIMGFHMLQKSVWVHPFPCFEEIEFLRQIYGVGIDVTYLVAEKIENPTDLKEQFKLR